MRNGRLATEFLPVEPVCVNKQVMMLESSDLVQIFPLGI